MHFSFFCFRQSPALQPWLDWTCSIGQPGWLGPCDDSPPSASPVLGFLEPTPSFTPALLAELYLFLFLLLLLTAAHFMPRVHSLPYSFLFGPLSHAHQKWRNMRTAIGSYIHEKVSWVRGGPVICKTFALAPGKTSLEISIRVCM